MTESILLFSPSGRTHETGAKRLGRSSSSPGKEVTSLLTSMDVNSPLSLQKPSYLRSHDSSDGLEALDLSNCSFLGLDR